MRCECLFRKRPDCGPLLIRELAFPAELLDDAVCELRVSVLDGAVLRRRMLGKKPYAIVLQPPSSAEWQSTLAHGLVLRVKQRRAGMFQLGGSPAGPGQPVIFSFDRSRQPDRRHA